MKRVMARLALVMAALFVLACMGLAWPLQLVLIVTLGWARYLYRVVPHVRVDARAAATATTCLLVLFLGLHSTLSWLYDQTQRALDSDRAVEHRWRRRWTVWIICTLVLMFVAGIATVGVAHQTGWLIASPTPLLASDFTGALARLLSTNNLKQIGLALHNYNTEHGSYPPAAMFDGQGRPMHGWQAAILPFLEQPKLYSGIDFRVPWNDVCNTTVYRTTVNAYLFPRIDRTNDAAGYALSHYAGNVFVLGGGVARTPRDISDGESNTIAAGEAASDFKPWGNPTNWRDPGLGINKSPVGFGSASPGGANFLFVDGSVRFLKNTINPRVIKALATPTGGEKVSTDEY
jgi:prepilin-type processing-associated H-X9-DG protein